MLFVLPERSESDSSDNDKRSNYSENSDDDDDGTRGRPPLVHLPVPVPVAKRRAPSPSLPIRVPVARRRAPSPPVTATASKKRPRSASPPAPSNKERSRSASPPAPANKERAHSVSPPALTNKERAYSVSPPALANKERERSASPPPTPQAPDNARVLGGGEIEQLLACAQDLDAAIKYEHARQDLLHQRTAIADELAHAEVAHTQANALLATAQAGEAAAADRHQKSLQEEAAARDSLRNATTVLEGAREACAMLDKTLQRGALIKESLTRQVDAYVASVSATFPPGIKLAVTLDVVFEDTAADGARIHPADVGDRLAPGLRAEMAAATAALDAAVAAHAACVDAVAARENATSHRLAELNTAHDIAASQHAAVAMCSGTVTVLRERAARLAKQEEADFFAPERECRGNFAALTPTSRRFVLELRVDSARVRNLCQIFGRVVTFFGSSS